MQELREVIVVGAIVVSIFLVAREGLRWYWKIKRDRKNQA